MNAIAEKSLRCIAIIGNPNSGKTSIFNALTGMRQKVGNYPGVTVEKKVGSLSFVDGTEALLVDLPGTYSLSASSPDEKIATDVLLGKLHGTTPPELVICVLDAANLERNLYLFSQIIDHHIPVVVALNMVDIAERDGVKINVEKLSQELGVPVVPTVGSRGIGIEALRGIISGQISVSPRVREWRLPDALNKEWNALTHQLRDRYRLSEATAWNEAIALLTSPDILADRADRYDPDFLKSIRKNHEKMTFLGIDPQSVIVEARYDWIKNVCEKSLISGNGSTGTESDKIDRILTHKVWGYVIFLGLMAVVFQTIFSWATAPMEFIASGFEMLGSSVKSAMPPGDLRNLIVNGALPGVGAVVMFLPQILFLFFFLGLLEDTGYMARAAFIMDKLMGKVGLHGKSFIPLLSSFACAIPGIMATRTIDSRKDRLVTMLVAPLIGCSARLPVYTLLIAAFIPQEQLLGIFSLPGLTLIGLYLLGLGMALAFAWIFKKTLLKGEVPTFIMELPPYKMPSLKSVLIQMWERSYVFLRKAGTIILGVSIILWFLASYPKLEGSSSAVQLEQSFAGRAGHLIEPLIAPLGFDWKIGIGLIGSLLQREVFVSTMGTIYNVKNADDETGTVSLRDQMRADINPETGEPVFTTLTALCLLVYYVLAMQCMSTLAVVRRETNSWKWPLFQLAYMTGLAYSVTLAVNVVGKWIQG